MCPEAPAETGPLDPIAASHAVPRFSDPVVLSPRRGISVDVPGKTRTCARGVNNRLHRRPSVYFRRWSTLGIASGGSRGEA